MPSSPLLDDPNFVFTSWTDAAPDMDAVDYTVSADTTEQAAARAAKAAELERQAAMKLRYLRWQIRQAIIGMLDPINGAVYPTFEAMTAALQGEPITP